MEARHIAQNSNFLMKMHASKHRSQRVFTSEGDVS